MFQLNVSSFFFKKKFKLRLITYCVLPKLGWIKSYFDLCLLKPLSTFSGLNILKYLLPKVTTVSHLDPI